MSGDAAGARGARRRGRRLPPLPAARRLARAGRAREARRVRGRGRTGAARSRASATPTRASSCSASRPAAHGGNRTGRVFTGDRSGDWLFAALCRCGLANQPRVALARRRAASCTAPTSPPRCAARRRRTSRCRPSATTALPYLERELTLLRDVRVDRLPRRLRLGRGAARCAPRSASRRRARSRASATAPSSPGERWTLLGCYHPSQQNTFTGRLTEPMTRRGLRCGRGSWPERARVAQPEGGRRSSRRGR